MLNYENKGNGASLHRNTGTGDLSQTILLFCGKLLF